MLGSGSRGRTRRAATVIVFSAALLLGSSGTALADSGSASVDGASGSAGWTFGVYSLTDVSYTVKDTACDDHAAYVQLEVYTSNSPNGTYTRGLRNESGCHSTVGISGQRYASNFRINGVRVRVCVDDWGSDTCDRSAYVDNPNI